MLGSSVNVELDIGSYNLHERVRIEHFDLVLAKSCVKAPA